MSNPPPAPSSTTLKHHHPTAQSSLATPSPLCPLSLLPITPHNSYVTTTPILLVSPRHDARNLPKQDYYVTNPETWPHKTVLSVWTPDRGVFLTGSGGGKEKGKGKPEEGDPGIWPRVIILRGVAVNRLYEEDTVHGVLRRVKEGEGRGQLNIYRGHPGGWWASPGPGDSEEVFRLMNWWQEVMKGQKEKEELEEKQRKKEERERVDEMERVRKEAEEEARRRKGDGRDVWEGERERYEKVTQEMRAQGRTWGPEGKWWRVDGLY